tara:strand:- start:138 stop:272 length:135 start_codon:yes stop_codon:yes gene_type:complete
MGRACNGWAAGRAGVYGASGATNLRETNIEALQAVAEIIRRQKC